MQRDKRPLQFSKTYYVNGNSPDGDDAPGTKERPFRTIGKAADHAMNLLARLDPRKVQIIEIRFFGGLSVEETAEIIQKFSFSPS